MNGLLALVFCSIGTRFFCPLPHCFLDPRCPDLPLLRQKVGSVVLVYSFSMLLITYFT